MGAGASSLLQQARKFLLLINLAGAERSSHKCASTRVVRNCRRRGSDLPQLRNPFFCGFLTQLYQNY